ncbi:hypothetical protein QAD02_007534 [Eretmocerus hayati]|uniref:Uncharacterized protein n=1 Tax=Eretmocerus hayati TaxID=131215 RepID=A0ACC2N492_9HYME|nr:hypothetical protein QAD02_007534 [Eretmocerus hayati]
MGSPTTQLLPSSSSEAWHTVKRTLSWFAVFESRSDIDGPDPVELSATGKGAQLKCSTTHAHPGGRLATQKSGVLKKIYVFRRPAPILLRITVHLSWCEFPPPPSPHVLADTTPPLFSFSRFLLSTPDGLSEQTNLEVYPTGDLDADKGQRLSIPS